MICVKQINDKRYYFECGIVSLPFCYVYFNRINQYKMYKKQKVENWIQEEKNILSKLEKEALLNNHRLSTLQFIYHKMPEFRDLKPNKRCASDIENINTTINIRKYILNVF